MIIIHLLHLGSAFLLLYTTYFAIKEFKLAIWKKGWYFIEIGAIIIIIAHLALFSEKLENVLASLDTISIICISIGIFLLANSARKMFGGGHKRS